MRAGRDQEEKGLTVRQLVFAFLGLVALCAVFFSLGFFVGYKERSSYQLPATENVRPTGDVPAPVNPTPEAAESTSVTTGGPATSAPTGQPAAEQTSTEAGEGSKPLSSAPSQAGEGSSPGGSAKSENAAAQASQPLPTHRGVTGIAVQVAALRNQEDAQNLVSVLEKRGYSAFVTTPEQARAHDGLFRVAVGPFKSSAEAEKVCAKLAAEGFQPFVRK